MFVGPVEVKFERAPDLATGMFRIRSQALAGVVQMPGYRAAPATPTRSSRATRRSTARRPDTRPPPPPACRAWTARRRGVPPQPQPAMGGYPPPAPQMGAPAAPTFWVEINGVRHPLNRPVTSMGRGTDVDLRVDDPSVSRRHAEIRTGMPSVISDLGSTNGIVVDDQHVRQAQLRDGSVIHLGNTTIIFRQG